MRIEDERQSENVEDRRGARMPGGRLVGGGIGTIALVLVAMYFGIDPRIVLQGVQMANGPAEQQSTGGPPPADQEPARKFVGAVLADTEDTWGAIFQQMGRRYENPKLVLFSGATQTACGTGEAGMGPFYCPEDQKVYIDLDFYRELRDRFQAPGDFAQAYVVAHEIGHHVQNQLGIADKVRAAREQADERASNALSVRMELQADCYAGVWANQANRTRNILEQGDIEEGLNAASAIGDDHLQKQTRGYVTPDSFTHGSSEQRVKWFKQGLTAGDIKSCDTFSAPAP
jgi:predicted metalloprotease